MVPMINLLGCTLGQNRPWGNRNINKLYKRLKMQNWVSFFLVLERFLDAIRHLLFDIGQT